MRHGVPKSFGGTIAISAGMLCIIFALTMQHSTMGVENEQKIEVVKSVPPDTHIEEMRQNTLELLRSGIFCVVGSEIMVISESVTSDLKVPDQVTEEAVEMDMEEMDTYREASEPVYLEKDLDMPAQSVGEEAAQEIGEVFTEDEPVYVEEAAPVADWVAELSVASSHSQLIIVSARGTSATVSMHNKNEDGTWSELLSTSGRIGKNGLGKTAEGDKKTPTGVYGFTTAFGILPNPGCAIGYTQVDDSYYWVDDSYSQYYNQFVSTNVVGCDWNSAEHITGIGRAYHYVLAIDYNSACTPGVGSAIFLHCSTGSSTAGCVSVPEQVMIQIMQNLRADCAIVIDSESGVYGY